MTTYTNLWFEITGINNFEKYVPKEGNFLEIGCYEGKASNWLMKNTKAELIVVDTFKGGQDLPDEVNLLDRFRKNIEPYKERIDIMVGKSQEGLRRFIDINFDFIYIDGSHLACDTLEDAVLAFRLLKKGGIIIFDDYTWGMNLPPLERPATGINAFIGVFSDQLEVLEHNSQMIIKKN